jgi:molybdopterin synthase catalytic subunit
MRVHVLLFAALREAVGAKELFLELRSGASVQDALAVLGSEHPALDKFRGRVLVSVNREHRSLETPLSDGDEIAILPPVSGGSGSVRVQVEPLSLDALLAEVQSPDCGGIVTFTGAVRSVSRGQRIDHLEYEAYEPMALRELERIRAEVRSRWPEVRLAIAHRLGRLELGEAAVVIVAASPHRADAFDACRYAIDTLKKTVPIWKKEFGEEGSCWVEENP